MDYIIKIIKTDHNKVEEVLYDDVVSDDEEKFKNASEDEIVAELLENSVRVFSN